MSDLGLLEEVVGLAAGRADYAEARLVRTERESLAIRNGHADEVDRHAEEGVGVRVLRGGAWGFAATHDLSRDGVRGAVERALALAEALPSSGARPLAPVEPARGHWETVVEIDPLAAAPEERLEHLAAAEALLRGDDRIVRSSATFSAVRTEKALVSSDGAACTQRLVECGAGLQAIAADGGEVQTRSYPSAHGGGVLAAGWEHVVALGLVEQAPRVAEEAVALLTAPVCPEGSTTLVLGDEQLALQIHESIGHALELDRIQLGEASYAGTSWVTPEVIGRLRYGSDHLNITADATLPGGLGSFGWDDEGVAAARVPLIVEGNLVSALSDRQSAAALGLDRSGGCGRADGFARQPIVRMTNVSIEPGGAGSLADLLADTGDGIFMDTNKSWSIDDRRWQFQFATEVAYEIKGGELGQLYRNPSYAGITPEFWGSLDAVCGPQAWRLHGLTNCGKGEPGQLMHVSHGAAPARFRGVQVGVA